MLSRCQICSNKLGCFVPPLSRDIARNLRWISVSGKLMQKSSNNNESPGSKGVDYTIDKATESSAVVQGLLGRPVHDFSPVWCRDVITDAKETPELENAQPEVPRNPAEPPTTAVPIETYRHSSNVSLYSVMQSNVPHPYSRNPTHLNMPSGGEAQQQKYVSGLMQSVHPHRKFSTSHQVNVTGTHEQFHNDITFPQGIQGEGCDRFKLWMKNCQQFSMGGCDEQLQSLKSGRKTLSQVLQDQERIIEEVVAAYNHKTKSSHPSYDADSADLQGVQEGVPARKPQFLSDDGDYAVQGDQVSDINDTILTAYESPCPQGVQGSDCHNYKLWLENCMKYGFNDCVGDLAQFQGGRKTLAMIFADQERRIQEIAEQYQSQSQPDQLKERT